MSKVNFYKVNQLPQQCEPNSIYFVKINGKEETLQYITDSNGTPSLNVDNKLPHISYNELEQDLKATINNGIDTNIDWSQAVAFQLDELVSDTTFTFQNVQENKQIKLILKGNVALTFPSNVNVDDIDYNGDEWNVIVFEATNINGSITIKAFSL